MPRKKRGIKMTISRIDNPKSIDFRTCSFTEFKANAHQYSSTLNLLREAIESTVDSFYKADYVLNEIMRKKSSEEISTQLSAQYAFDEIMHKKSSALSSNGDQKPQNLTPEKPKNLSPEEISTFIPPELDEILKLDHPRKIVTRLLQYQDTAKGENNWYVNLLLAENYVKLESYDIAIECIITLFDDNLYFKFHHTITKLIIDIAQFNKDKARVLLKAQYEKGIAQKNTSYDDIKYIVHGLQIVDLFDEKLEKDLLTLLNKELDLNYRESDRLDKKEALLCYEVSKSNSIMVALLCLAPKISDANRQQLLDLLFKEYHLELKFGGAFGGAAEINYQLIFEQLVKSDYFNKMPVEKLEELLNTFVNQYHDIQVRRRYSKTILFRLDQLKVIIKEPAHLYAVQLALAKCNLDDLYIDEKSGAEKVSFKLENIPVNQLSFFYSKLENIPLDQLRLFFSVEVESKNPRFYLILSITYVLRSRHGFFDEKQQKALLKYYNQIFRDKDYYELKINDRKIVMESIIDILSILTESNQVIMTGILGEQYLNELRMSPEISQNIFSVLVKRNAFKDIDLKFFPHFVNTIALLPTESRIAHLNQIKKMVTSDRINIVNLAILNCYANCYGTLTDLSTIEKAIEISKEVEFDSPDILKNLAKKIEFRKPDVAIEFLLRCHKLGDFDALLDIALIYEKEEKITDVINYYKLSITEAVKTSNWSLLKRGMSQLFTLLASQGGGFKTAEKEAVREIILLGYKTVFEDQIKDNSSKIDFLNLLCQCLIKTRRFIDLSELIGILHKDYVLDYKFLELACGYFPETSEKYKEYDCLRKNMLAMRMKLQALKTLSISKSYTITNLLLDIIEKFSESIKFIADAKDSPLFNEVKQILEECVSAVIAHGSVDSKAFDLLFSNEIEKLGPLAKILQKSIEKILVDGKYYTLLFQLYFQMYQTDKFENKNEIAKHIIDVISMVQYFDGISKINFLHIFKYPFLRLAMDPSLEEDVKSNLKKFSREFYLVSNADKSHAKEFVRISHLPAITFLINRKYWVGNNPGYDYLCALLLILTKGCETPELKDTINKAKSRIQNLREPVRKKYVELIQTAPVHLDNVHAYLRRNVTKKDAMHDVFLQGMQQALGLKDKIVWVEWLQLIDSINAPSKSDIKITPSAPEESKIEKSVTKPLTTDDVTESIKIPALSPSAPPMDEAPKMPTTIPSAATLPITLEDEDEPGRPQQVTTPIALFYHSPGEQTKTTQERAKTSLLVPG